MTRPIFTRFSCAGARLAATLILLVALPALLPVAFDAPALNVLALSQVRAQTAQSTPENLNNQDLQEDAPQSRAQQSKSSVPLRSNSPLLVEPVAPLELPGGGNADPARREEADDGAATRTLGAAMQEMVRRNPVVATIEGEEIRWRDVLESARDLPPEYRDRMESVFPALLDRLIDLKLLANAGRNSGLDENKDLRRRVRAYEDVLIRDAYVAEKITSQIPETEVRARYFEALRANAALTERHLRHVVVASRDEALAIVQSLDDGLDFAELARNYSIGDSAARGGDLGFMRRGSLEPGFANEAFDLQIGSYNRLPLRTEFGWHVIKVESERKAALPAFEELEPDLREGLARQRMNAVLKKLRNDADLEIFPDE